MRLNAKMGATPTGLRLERMKASAQWAGDHFANALPGTTPEFGPAAWQFLKGGSRHREPRVELPIMLRRGEEFALPPAEGLRLTWLGHSSTLIEIDGARILLDPVFGERVSPFSFAGPKRFHAPPLPTRELPPLDLVLISHDHYDHLDYPTVLELAQRDVPFVVPLGVGAHLEHWGIPAERITELDWWESHRVADVLITATPARHFSGRSLGDRDHTLWAGFAIQGPDHRVYFSGDTSMFPGFSEIGARLGPFDVALMESGAYNALWRDAHIGPEQAILAAQMVGAERVLPVHWGTFNLSLHGWTEPVERMLRAARTLDMPLLTPRPGESVEWGRPFPQSRWWPELPWESASDAPLVSTGLERTLLDRLEPLVTGADPA